MTVAVKKIISMLFQFQKQVLRCLAAWMDWAVYTPDFLFDLENVFLGHGDKPGISQTVVGDLHSLPYCK